jgi:hypothetical protein
VARLRHDHDVVGALECVRARRLVDEPDGLAVRVVLPDLTEVERPTGRAVEVEALAVAPDALFAVEDGSALVLRLKTHRREARDAVTALVGVVLVIRLVDRHPLDAVAFADLARDVHVRPELALQLQGLERPVRVRKRTALLLAAVAAAIVVVSVRQVAVEAGAAVRGDIAVLGLVKDAVQPSGRLVREAAGGNDRPSLDGPVRVRIDLERVPVLPGAALDDLFARDPAVLDDAAGAVRGRAAEDREVLDHVVQVPPSAVGVPS